MSPALAHATWLLSSLFVLMLFHQSLNGSRHCRRYEYVYLSTYPCPLEVNYTIHFEALVPQQAECKMHRLNQAGLEGFWPVPWEGEMMAKCVG